MESKNKRLRFILKTGILDCYDIEICLNAFILFNCNEQHCSLLMNKS